MAYSLLGYSRLDCLGVYPILLKDNPTSGLYHNEVTNLKNGSSPLIGSGTTKTLRDSVLWGYTLVIFPGIVLVYNVLIKESAHHIRAYDIET